MAILTNCLNAGKEFENVNTNVPVIRKYFFFLSEVGDSISNELKSDDLKKVTMPHDLKIGHFWPPRAHGRRMAGVKEALNYVFLLIQMWFEALKSFYFNSRVPGRPCHCYLKSAIFDPLCPREKDGRGQSGPKSCFPVNIEVIRGDKEFPRWFQAPCLTLPLWPDFDLKISHFWSPRAQTGRVAGVKAALYHVFPLI